VGEIRWARSATKHRVSKSQITYVIEHSRFAVRLPPSTGRTHDRFLFLGKDQDGRSLEVVALLLDEGDLLVIHAMPMRKKHRAFYLEVKRWLR